MSGSTNNAFRYAAFHAPYKAMQTCELLARSSRNFDFFNGLISDGSY